MVQQSLSDLFGEEGVSAAGGSLDTTSEAFLARYREAASRERSPDAVRGEVSQLRSVVRESVRVGGPATLDEVLGDPITLASVLTTPSRPLSASTAFCRLRAIQTAFTVDGDPGEARQRVEALDALLPRMSDTSWHASGIKLAGSRRRRRPQSVTIEPSDLPRIVAAAAGGKHGLRALRDPALVATYCFSGLRVSEITSLRWSDLRCEQELEGWSAQVERATSRTRLAIVGPAATALVRLRATLADADDRAARFVFVNARGQMLTGRQVRRIVSNACRAAGFQRADRTTLLSAFAAYLEEAGLTDHEIAIMLGVADLRTIDRLLRPHHALRSQRLASP